MKRVIVVGSPRSNGRSAHLAEMLFEANIDEFPEDELFLVPVSEIEVGPCIGCGACRKPSEVILRGDDGAEATVMRHRCVFDDDMQSLYDVLDDADELIIVSPVYFSGAPAPMKCVLDRLQPYFWESRKKDLEQRLAEKRPATLHVLGEGGDPHGYAPLVSEVRSATAVAGFRLERVLDWVGKIDEHGEITAEAEEVEGATFEQRLAAEPKQRPKLDLGTASSGQSQVQSQGQGRSQGKRQNRGSSQAQGKAQGTSKGRSQARQGQKKQSNQGKRQAKNQGKGSKRG